MVSIEQNRSNLITYDEICGASIWTTLALVGQIVHAAQHLGHADYRDLDLL